MNMSDFELLTAFGEIELDQELASAKQAFYDSLDRLAEVCNEGDYDETSR